VDRKQQIKYLISYSKGCTYKAKYLSLVLPLFFEWIPLTYKVKDFGGIETNMALYIMEFDL